MMVTISPRRRAAWALFAIGTLVYFIGFVASGFGHAKNAITICGLVIQFAGVALMVGDMYSTWRARRAGTPQRR